MSFAFFIGDRQSLLLDSRTAEAVKSFASQEKCAVLNLCELPAINTPPNQGAVLVFKGTSKPIDWRLHSGISLILPACRYQK